MSILNKKDLNANPYCQFDMWFEEAKACGKINIPEAMCLATVDEEGYPDTRIVLLKEYSLEEGFVFYTNTHSPKGRQLEKISKAALNFYWMPVDLQVRLQGDVSAVTSEMADEYFATRPRLSQVGAWASDQSAVVENRDVLEDKFKSFEKKFEGGDVPRPPHWSGYQIKPKVFEFWKNQDNRMHDRFSYHLNSDGTWDPNRLNP